MTQVEKADRRPMSLDEKIRYIELSYPVFAKTEVAGLVTTVRRMKAERDWQVPPERRSIFEILGGSVTQANATGKEEWNGCFGNLSAELLINYPQHWERIFGF